MKIAPTLSRGRGKIILLAPSDSSIPPRFAQVGADENGHERVLARMQRFRGALYLRDGAIQPAQLSSDGRHCQPADQRSWHVLLLDLDDEIYGCSRYIPYSADTPFTELGVANCALAHCPTWGHRFKSAVESDKELAKKRGVAYAEVGGWALAPEMRKNSAEALRIVLATYCLARILGGCIGIGTVTVRHQANTILRRIGGKSLMSSGFELPRYFDPQYGCEMETLGFDSSSPSSRFAPGVHEMCAQVLDATIVSGDKSYRWLAKHAGPYTDERTNPSRLNLSYSFQHAS